MLAVFGIVATVGQQGHVGNRPELAHRHATASRGDEEARRPATARRHHAAGHGERGTGIQAQGHRETDDTSRHVQDG